MGSGDRATPATGGDVLRWRTSPRVRYVSLTQTVVSIAVGVATAIGVLPLAGADLAGNAGLGALLLALGFGVFRQGVWPILEATPDGLVIRNAVRRYVVAWDEIESLAPGNSGIVVTRRGRRRVIATAVPNQGLAYLFERRARANRVIADVAAARARWLERPDPPGGSAGRRGDGAGAAAESAEA